MSDYIENDLLRRVKEQNIDIKIESLIVILEPIIEKLFKKQLAKEEETKPLMNISDIAKKFKVTPTTVQNWRRRGVITGTKVGKNRYFTEEEVKKALGTYGWENRLRGEAA